MDTIIGRIRIVCLIVAVLGVALILTGSPSPGGIVLLAAVGAMLAARVIGWIVSPR